MTREDIDWFEDSILKLNLSPHLREICEEMRDDAIKKVEQEEKHKE